MATQEEASSATTVSIDGLSKRFDTAEDVEELCTEIESKDVQVLSLQGNTFNIEAAERVGQVLAHQPNLREAHLKDLFTSRGREIVPTALGHILQGISQSAAQLELLDLSDNAIGPIGAPTVIEFLESESAQTIKKFYIHNCGMGPEGSSSLAPHIAKLKHLEEFICGRNRLENKGATNMSIALSQLEHLRLLKLNQNGIFVPGIKKLVDALEANAETIEIFDFSDNVIKQEGAEAMARVLPHAKNLKVIQLDDDLLGSDGFQIICETLQQSPCLKNLTCASFEGNEIRGNKIVDLVINTFSECGENFTLNLLENEFNPTQSARLEGLSSKFTIYVDDVDTDDDEDDEEEESDSSGSDTEDGGYVNLGDIESEMREVSQEFVAAFKVQPLDQAKVNSLFVQLTTTGFRPGECESVSFDIVQVLCEELGLMKIEETRQAKPLARDAIVYLGKRRNELPKTFRDFLDVVVRNRDDLACGKMLFGELDV